MTEHERGQAAAFLMADDIDPHQEVPDAVIAGLDSAGLCRLDFGAAMHVDDDDGELAEAIGEGFDHGLDIVFGTVG